MNTTHTSKAMMILRTVALPAMVLVVISVLGWVFYERSHTIMEDQLRAHLSTTVSIAAGQFTAAQIDRIHGAADVTSQSYGTVVRALDAIRQQIPNVRYAYIMRATGHTTTLEFVADADAFAPIASLDRNKNGRLDPQEQPALPGNTYDASTQPSLLAAFDHAAVDAVPTRDAWGTFISAYAPIKDDTGNTVAILGIDIDAADFEAMTQSLFSPILLLLMSLAVVCIVAYVIIAMRQHQVETLQQLENDRIAMLSLATHQLGMPLATFKWWLEILREGKDTSPAEHEEACDQLQEGISRLNQIINSLMRATHLQEGTVEEIIGKVSVPFIVQETTALTATQLQHRSQTLTVEVPSSLPPVRADAKLLIGVLRELIENASFYSSQGSQIHVRARLSYSHLQIEVEDHGCGISKEDLPKLFHKFSRGANASTYKPAGTGMGLFICKGIVERAGGSLWIKSELNKGTTVYLTLPIS